MNSSFFNPLPIPVLGFCAYSGTGKTTLLKKLIPALNQRGLKIGVVKHAHHNFDIDIPGKDSFEMRKVGAKQILVASHVRWALITEQQVDGDPELTPLLKQIDANNLDIVLVEGFKKLALPKIELYRADHHKPFIYTQDDNILAVACCDQTDLPTEIKRLDLNNIEQIADYVMQYISHWQPTNLKLPVSSVSATQTANTLSVAQGVQHILDSITPLVDSENLVLDELNNRVLATDLLSPINVPQHNNSAMDGYAFNLDNKIAEYQIVGDAFAGHSYDGELKAGQAIRIMTGAPVPIGANTVVARENATEYDATCDDKSMGKVSVNGKVVVGQHIRLAGEDISKGAIAIKSGTRLASAAQGFIASLGMRQAPVYRRPIIAVFSTGDEVSEPGTPLQKNCIYDSNRYTIKSMAKRLGCELMDLGIIEDSKAALTDTLIKASDIADVIISSGGVSVGNADYIKQVLADIGQINFWRINMRPGRPLAFGQIGKASFFGLPGNPVAVMVTMLQFVQPALRKLAGETSWKAAPITAITDEKLMSRLGRTDFFRGIYQLEHDGRLHVKTTGPQGSGILNSMVKANCLIIMGEQDDQLSAGDKVYIQPFADLL